MRVGWNTWSVEINDSWIVTDHPECLTLELSDEGALQISSAKKDSADVTDDDLQDFVDADWGPAQKTECGDFGGILFRYTEDGDQWMRWILRNKKTVLFITYNGSHEAAASELTAVLQVLSSARAEAPSEA